jgi:threonine dehydrogenase-like Zn-dependent dehydrogenase
MVYPADIKPNEDVLLVGQGPMGLTATQFAALNARSVTTVDMHQNRLDKSLEIGSKYAYDRSKMSADEIVAAIEKATGGADVAFMCIDEDKSPELDAWDMAVKALRPGGRMSSLLLAVKNLRNRLNPNPLLLKNIRLQHELGRPCDPAEVTRQAMDLVTERRINMGRLITHEVGLEEVAEALDMTMNRPGEVIKVIVHPS